MQSKIHFVSLLLNRFTFTLCLGKNMTVREMQSKVQDKQLRKHLFFLLVDKFLPYKNIGKKTNQLNAHRVS